MAEIQKEKPDKTTILVPCSNIEKIDTILFHAVPMAKVFDSTLTFLFMGDEIAYNLFKTEIENKAAVENIADKVRVMHFSTISIHTPVIEKNNNDEEAIIVIFPQLPLGRINYFGELKFMMKAKKLRLPFMVLQSGSETADWKPKNIILPIGSSRSDKETALWASYFARFGTSEITVLYAKEKNPIYDRSTRGNVRFVLTLFRKLNVRANVVHAKSRSGKLHQEAAEMAHKDGNSLLIISTTRYYNIEHLLLGPMELETLKNNEKVPVLCINPRKDLYVLCR